MRRWLIVMLLMAAHLAMGQPLYEHRGVQYATHGTDFWVCFPRTLSGVMYNSSSLYFVAEHNCDVTVSNDLLGFSQTIHLKSRLEVNSRLDTINQIELPSNIVSIIDTLRTGVAANQQLAARPQPRAFHITSTDTVSVYALVYGQGAVDVTNVLPTEMLRDEYVIQTYPSPYRRWYHFKSMVHILATEDNTEVDVTLSDMDWLGRPKNTTFTVTLQKGQLYYFQNATSCCKYGNCVCNGPPGPKVYMQTHSFTPETILCDTFTVDLSGTYIKARDNKRIAVFQGNQYMIANDDGVDGYAFEQAMPIRYAGMEYVIPDIVSSRKDVIRFTALVDSTDITIMAPFMEGSNTRQLHLDARETDWFWMEKNVGPFYVTANHPILVSSFSDGGDTVVRIPFQTTSGPGTMALVPVEWWHNGYVSYAPVCYIDPNRNGYPLHHSTQIFVRTEDVEGMHLDHYLIDTCFIPMPGTPYSYAVILYNTNYNTRRVHLIENWLDKPFWAFGDASKNWEHELFSYGHVQKGKNYLTVNDIPAEELNPDSNWCMYDPICFQGWVERPADSIIWEFGDGLEERYLYEDGQNVTHTYADTGRFTVNRIIKYKDEGLDSLLGYVGCKSVFTRPPDTMSAHIWVRSRIDTSFVVKLCEGSYFFRGYELATTDTHYVTTYWTESGCDTLWKIDLTTCPHCSFYSDTISDEQLPWTFNDITFAHETRHYPIYIDIGDECDSIIDYYLIVIPHWGEPPLDTTFILAPNAIIPNSDIEVNRRFRLFCSKDIEVAEVYVFDRVGRRLAHFDGLTEEWDGTYKGVLLPQGTYVYYVRYKDGSNRNWKTTDGTFTILR